LATQSPLGAGISNPPGPEVSGLAGKNAVTNPLIARLTGQPARRYESGAAGGAML